jgi:hypothetical protein
MRIRYQQDGFDFDRIVGDEIGIMDDNNVVLVKVL